MSLLSRKAYQGVGSTIGGYTVPAGKTAVLIGANFANIKDVLVKISFVLESAEGVKANIVKDLAIPPNSAFSFSGLEQKLVMVASDKINWTVSEDKSLDVWLSISELEA